MFSHKHLQLRAQSYGLSQAPVDGHRTVMHCSILQGKVHALLLCATVQNPADSSLVSVQLHL